MSENVHMSPQQAKFAKPEQSSLALYREYAVGDSSYLFLTCFELCSLLSANTPGLLGFALRRLMYPFLFGRCGRRPAIGRSVVVRNPRRIELGDKVLIDDFVTLDVRGTKGTINLGSFVSVGRYTAIVSKDAQLELGAAVNIGSHCRIASQSAVSIGESTLVAAYCYIGAGNHQRGDENQPLISREMDIRGGVKIGKHAWIGAHTTIMDGVSIGDGAIVGAHSFVKDDIPAGATAIGCPAKVIAR